MHCIEKVGNKLGFSSYGQLDLKFNHLKIKGKWYLSFEQIQPLNLDTLNIASARNTYIYCIHLVKYIFFYYLKWE